MIKKLKIWIIDDIKQWKFKDVLQLVFSIVGIFGMGFFLNNRIAAVKVQEQINTDSIKTYTEENEAKIDKLETLLKDTNIEGNANFLSGNYSDISNFGNTNNYFDNLIDENTSEESLLIYAENAIDAGAFDECIKIYSMEKLQDNPIANNNMGFLFANGISFDENIATADAYYDKAIAEGSEKAFDNKIAMHLRNNSEDSIELLEEGVESNDKPTVEFIARQSEEYGVFTEDDKRAYAENFFNNMTKEQKLKSFEDFYDWNYINTVYLSYSPEGKFNEKYILAGENSWFNTEQDIAGTTKAYKKYILRCKNIDVFEEGVERVK